MVWLPAWAARSMRPVSSPSTRPADEHFRGLGGWQRGRPPRSSDHRGRCRIGGRDRDQRRPGSGGCRAGVARTPSRAQMSAVSHAARAPAWIRGLSAKTLGVLAVLGLVVAFSFSSTLVKRAETAGVLVAFWRLAVVSLAWNVVLWSTGRRITLRDVRAVWIPGVFFGLNLAVFFAGATHNSVANAALIGSCAPFLIVPVGAWLFGEYLDPRAIVFALLAFGGVVLVLVSAPPGGDASLEGNVFGVIAMLLLVAYVASTRYFRRDMDVTTFMATICPIATFAVLPVAIAHGGMFSVSVT